MKYELTPYHRNTSDEELLNDLKKVAAELGKDKITVREYIENGKFSVDTIARRFGTWNKALEKADLNITHKQNSSNEELFENIEEMWIKLGRQPVSAK